MLGELPTRTSIKAYYPLNGITILDSSGNGRNLTNVNSVSFTNGKFKGGADFGTSGTNKALTYTTANILSGLIPANITFSCWTKLNNSSASNISAGLVHICTRLTSGSGAIRAALLYNIGSGNVTFTAFCSYVTSGNLLITHTTPANTSDWYHIAMVISNTSLVTLYVNGVAVTNGTGVGGYNQNANTIDYVTIGNRNAVHDQQAWATIDEVIFEERAWSDSEIRKYYTQARGKYINQMSQI